MNGIEKITKRIEADVQAEIDTILADAKASAEQISARYQSQAEQEAAELASQNQKAAAEREERLVSVCQMESRKVTLSAKQEMLDKAFSLALEQLCSLPDDQYTDTVAKLLVHAAPDGRGQVIFSKADRDRVGAAAVEAANHTLGEKGRLTLADETRPIRGGFILVSGSIEVNCTFETLVRLQKGEIASEVAKRLFPNG